MYQMYINTMASETLSEILKPIIILHYNISKKWTSWHD